MGTGNEKATNHTKRDIVIWLALNAFQQSCMGMNYGMLNRGLLGAYKKYSVMHTNEKIEA